MSFSDYPWCSRALNLFAPHPDEVDRFCRFIEEQLVPDGIDTLMLIVRNDYEFVSHPEFSETPLSDEPEYSYSLCPCAPGLYEIVTDLMDELIDAFSADWLHMGGDEVFCIGMCERCRETASGELFARW